LDTHPRPKASGLRGFVPSENPCAEGEAREKLWQAWFVEELAMPRHQFEASKHQVRLPRHVVDLDADELHSVAGQHVDLRPRSFAVLRLLAENAGHLVSKDVIMSAIWGDVVVTEDSLIRCIADIRTAIGDHDRRILRTMPHRGYILVPTQRSAELTGRIPGLPALAVMPFLGVAGDNVLGYGVASEIINELARNKQLRLIARDSSFALANEKLMAQELGERLRARYLVEGTALRFQDSLIVDVQLVDTRDGSIVWGDRFSATAEDIPQVQRTIAGTIAGSLHSSIRETEKHAILGATPRDLDVYELTLRGIARKHQFNPEATRAGRADFEEAIRRDPNYAPALAELARLNLIDMILQLTGERHFSELQDVIGLLSRAIELDPRLPSAYQGLSQALIYTGDVQHSVSLARRAVELGPSDADGLLFLALALFASGEIIEALGSVERAVALNPPRPAYYCFFHALILWGNGRLQDALEETTECLRKAPNFGAADLYRVIVLVGLGRLDEAKARLAQYMADPVAKPRVFPSPPELASRALAALKAAGWRPSVAAHRRRSEAALRTPASSGIFSSLSGIFSALSVRQGNLALAFGHGAGRPERSTAMTSIRLFRFVA
jgi:TolB-like protein